MVIVYRLQYTDTASLMRGQSIGSHAKDLITLHETVSPDLVGLADILNVERYLARMGKGWGIHGMTDAEGHKAWAHGMGEAIFYQAGGVNQRSIGIEQVSRVMLQSPNNAVRKAIWLARDKELRATARLCAAIHNTKPHKVPLVFSDGTKPGITSHYNVAKYFPASEGHSDCRPVHLGGYYPILYVIRLAKVYAATGVHL